MAGVVTKSQSIELDPVSDISVSAIALDDVRGDYYRDIVFFGEPADGESTVPTVLSVRIRAATVDPLKITVPQDEF